MFRLGNISTWVIKTPPHCHLSDATSIPGPLESGAKNRIVLTNFYANTRAYLSNGEIHKKVNFANVLQRLFWVCHWSYPVLSNCLIFYKICWNLERMTYKLLFLSVVLRNVQKLSAVNFKWYRNSQKPPLMVPKHENFSLAFFAVREPILVGDFGTDPKKTFFSFYVWFWWFLVFLCIWVCGKQK